MNKSQKALLINNLKECLSYLSPNVEQQVSKDENRHIAKLLTSIISGINLVKELLTQHKEAVCWKKEYDTILQLINEETRRGRFFTKTQFCHFFEDRFGLKGHHSIRKHINALATEGYITFHEKEAPGNNRRIKVMEAA
ncbi:Hypothetical protein CINCED_3A011212 [Cinara cedri]|uniref:Uncharacterized protein n=1 Tax=Cinara cedri TaxID=506608 RepID=A0A5E4MFL1_9HEMI|nr:Hypothetical protein CINCED_3A011212 [Cinara cedri]